MAKKKDSKATKANAWKGKTTAVDLTLPSGNVCLAKRPGMDTMMAHGKVPNTLMPVIQDAIKKAKGGKDVTTADLDLASLYDDPEKMASILDFQNAVVLATVIEPPLLPVPAAESERDEDLLYIDEIDVLDRSFLFQWAMGGSADLERFRSGLAEALADITTGEEVVSEAK